MNKDDFFSDDEPLTPTPVDEGSAPVQSADSIMKNRKWILLAILMIVVAVGGGYLLLKVIKTPKSYNPETTTEESTPEQDKLADALYLHLDTMVVPLLVTAGKASYLKITLSLYLSSPNDQAKVKAKLPLVADNVQTFLMNLRAMDFSSTGNILYVKEEILRRVNSVVAPLIVKDVLFKDLIIE